MDHPCPLPTPPAAHAGLAAAAAAAAASAPRGRCLHTQLRAQQGDMQQQQQQGQPGEAPVNKQVISTYMDERLYSYLLQAKRCCCGMARLHDCRRWPAHLVQEMVAQVCMAIDCM